MCTASNMSPIVYKIECTCTCGRRGYVCADLWYKWCCTFLPLVYGKFCICLPSFSKYFTVSSSWNKHTVNTTMQSVYLLLHNTLPYTYIKLPLLLDKYCLSKMWNSSEYVQVSSQYYKPCCSLYNAQSCTKVHSVLVYMYSIHCCACGIQAHSTHQHTQN
jgi:hypothetical protein